MLLCNDLVLAPGLTLLMGFPTYIPGQDLSGAISAEGRQCI